MPPNAPIDFRPILAAAAMWAVLAAAYEGARQLPHAPATRPPIGITMSTDSSAVGLFSPELAAAHAEVAGGAVAAPPATPPASPRSAAEEEEPPPPKCRPQPLRFAEKRTLGPRRYVGMVGGELATAEIDWNQPDSLSGRFYMWHSGLEYAFSQAARRSRVLVLSPPELSLTTLAAGQWRLTRPLGPVLQGIWVDSAGRHPRPFRLRESYQGGVHYDVRRLTMTGGSPMSPNSCDVPTCSRDFLHLLSPTARQWPLSRVQCPALPICRRQMHQEDYNAETHTEYYLHVLLNDFQLLSYEVYHDDMPFEGTSGGAMGNGLIDLATGRNLTVVSQLRPGYEQPLRRLLGKCFLSYYHQSAFDHLFAGFNVEWTLEHGRSVLLAPLPEEASGDNPNSMTGMGLGAQGLNVKYIFSGYKLIIPYPELRPLVRPCTPLARMLRARGLW